MFKDLQRLQRYIYHYLNGENYSEAGLASFEANEKYENKDKIAEMFEKKKKNVPIPEINKKSDLDEKGNPSEKSANTDTTKEIFKPREEEGPVDFKYKPMGQLKPSYIKYTPHMTPIGNAQDYNKIDYMLTEQDWEEAKNASKGISDNLRDLVEEMFDKFEKFTGKGDIQPLDKCKSALSSYPMITKKNFPHDAQLKSIYNGWIAARKKNGNALFRRFWKKPDQNDNSPTASFRSRVTEKIQTRRKNKNDQANYLKLQSLREEIVGARNILGLVMQREKLKMAGIDLEYMEIKQMIKEKSDPNYQCEDFKEFLENELDRTKVEFPEELAEEIEIDRENRDMYSDNDLPSLLPQDSIKSSVYEKKTMK